MGFEEITNDEFAQGLQRRKLAGSLGRHMLWKQKSRIGFWDG